MTQRSGGLPSPPEVAELLGADFARAGYEIDSVTVENATVPPRITVVADGDNPLDLDAIAALSRSASERLDAIPAIPDSYVLEVSSPGVDRPLTTEKHFRRARGRKVELDLADGSNLAGRLGRERRRRDHLPRPYRRKPARRIRFAALRHRHR